jgi:hypothetical protein
VSQNVTKGRESGDLRIVAPQLPEFTAKAKLHFSEPQKASTTTVEDPEKLQACG